MNGPEVEFDWDEANIGHVDRHSVLPQEAEQVLLNEPLDLGMEIVDGEERYLNLGATVQGRVLLVVTTSFITGNERGDPLWLRIHHPSRLRDKRPNGGRKIRT